MAAACLLTLSACSALRLGYWQADWLIERQIARYVTLDRDQQRLLESGLEDLLAWHCRTQLHEYAGWLRRVNADVQRPGLEVGRVRGSVAQLRDAWRRLMMQVKPLAVDLFRSLSDAQVDELLAEIARDNKEYEEEYVDPPEKERRRDRARWMEKQLERWLGAVTDRQKTAVSEWSRKVVPMGEAGLANRVQWRRELAAVLDRRHDEEALSAGLERLMVRWRDSQSDDYREHLEHNTRLAAALLIELSAGMTPRQRNHLENSLLGYAADMDSLSCRAG